VLLAILLTVSIIAVVTGCFLFGLRLVRKRPKSWVNVVLDCFIGIVLLVWAVLVCLLLAR